MEKHVYTIPSYLHSSAHYLHVYTCTYNTNLALKKVDAGKTPDKDGWTDRASTHIIKGSLRQYHKKKIGQQILKR